MDEIGQNISEVVIRVYENITKFVPHKDEEIPLPSSGDMTINIGLILCLAVIPILIGSWRSINFLKKKKNFEHTSIITTKEVLSIPFVSSIVLFTFYLLLQVISREYINLLITSYMMIFGDAALCALLSSVMKNNNSSCLLDYNVQLPCLNKSKKNRKFLCYENQKQNQGKWLVYNSIDDSVINVDYIDIVCFVISSAFSFWYLWQKHWIANNIFALTFAILIIEKVHLNTIINGCILLSGLFIFDIFWVYGTDVMETVALTLEAPNKLMIPRELITKGFNARALTGINDFSILGLGDVIIPGLFIALLLRFDKKLQRKHNSYSVISCIGYVIGLITTILFAGYYRRGQPALLFLVPPIVIFPAFLALIKGDSKIFYGYSDDSLLEELKTIEQSRNGSTQESNSISCAEVNSNTDTSESSDNSTSESSDNSTSESSDNSKQLYISHLISNSVKKDN